MVSEPKLDDAFPSSQFLVQGYSIFFKKHQATKRGIILLYARENISCKFNKTETDTYYEIFFIEINLRKKVVTKLLL